jgi:hypothetical protein
MPKSLLEQLPKIVAEGRQQAERILEFPTRSSCTPRRVQKGMGPR